MAKFELRLQARVLRSQGVSVKSIARQLNVSKSSASAWVKDIILTVEQLERLRKSAIKGAELGRLRSSLMQKKRKRDLLKQSQQDGIETVGKLSYRELLMAGIALYWGEGSKKNRRIELCNSDPKMVKFFLQWLKLCFSVSVSDIKCYVGINEMHRDREDIVKQYWSDITGIPLSQFTKTSFKKVQNKKVYANFHEHYGTFVVKTARSGSLYYRVMGLIEGLAENARVA